MTEKERKTSINPLYLKSHNFEKKYSADKNRDNSELSVQSITKKIQKSIEPTENKFIVGL